MTIEDRRNFNGQKGLVVRYDREGEVHDRTIRRPVPDKPGYYYLGLTQEETATVLGCTTGTAKSQVSRGLSKLRDLLIAERIDLSDLEVWSNAHM